MWIKNRTHNTGCIAGNYGCWISTKAKICSTIEHLPEIETGPRVSVGAEQQTKRSQDKHGGPSLFNPRRFLTNPGEAGGQTFEIPPSQFRAQSPWLVDLKLSCAPHQVA